MFNNGITFEVRVNGRAVDEYNKDDRFFVEGRKGSDYTLFIRNNTRNKVLAIPTVDGLSVLDGKEASYDSQGYILYAYSEYEVLGWRTDNDTTRNFFFTSHSKSYSEKTGNDTTNLGIIGLAVFKEKERVRYRGGNIPWSNTYIPLNISASGSGYYDNITTTASLDLSTKSRGASDLTQNSISSVVNYLQSDVGTGMGQKQESRVQNVSFNKEHNPFVTFEFLYYTKRQLEQMGVITKVKKQRQQAFPANNFCREV
tara:strand:+ start:2725 stop:3492 length:768 start_codon:yes stop_codon:yes gene_type:complete